MTEIQKQRNPEEEEIKQKKAELIELQAELAEWELKLATLQGKLYFFDREYFTIVGALYVELEEIEAQIAEYQALFNPEDITLQEKAQEARAKAKKSQEAQNLYNIEPGENQDFKPSNSLKKMYRSIARLVHPDLTTNEKERQFREQIMPLVNQAYESRDEERLQELYDQIVENTRLLKEKISEENRTEILNRILRQIKRIKNRIAKVKKQIDIHQESPLATMLNHCLNLKEEGRDLLAEMAAQVQEEIDIQQLLLDELILKAKSNLEKMYDN